VNHRVQTSVKRCFFLLSMVFPSSCYLWASDHTLRLEIRHEKSQLIFHVRPESSWNLNMNAPWKLTLSDGVCDGIFDKSQFDVKTADYKVPCDKKGVVKYRLEAFSCSADKSRCVRELMKGTYTL
jgi:hypothetical protein